LSLCFCRCCSSGVDPGSGGRGLPPPIWADAVPLGRANAAASNKNLLHLDCVSFFSATSINHLPSLMVPSPISLFHLGHSAASAKVSLPPIVPLLLTATHTAAMALLELRTPHRASTHAREAAGNSMRAMFLCAPHVTRLAKGRNSSAAQENNADGK